MDIERVAYFSQEEAKLERAKKNAEPLHQSEETYPYERLVRIAERVTSLPGCNFRSDKVTPSFSRSSRYKSTANWEHVFESDDTHERLLQLMLFVEYNHADEHSIPVLERIGAAWFDNLSRDDIRRQPISEEVVYIRRIPSSAEMERLHDALNLEDLHSPEMARRLGLLEESVTEAEKVSSS